MEIVITEWALDSYLSIRDRRAFTETEYRTIIRPDVVRLRNFPDDQKFRVQQFWSIAECPPSHKIQNGFKMKWDSLGSGKIELRLPIGILGAAYLCEAYVKENSKYEQRRLARFKVHLELIRRGQMTERGRLT